MDKKKYKAIINGYSKLPMIFRILAVFIIPIYALVVTLFEFVKGITEQIGLLVFNLGKVCYTAYIIVPVFIDSVFF